MAQRSPDPCERLRLQFAVAAVERTDPYGERQVEQRDTRLEHEVLDRYGVHRHAAGGDQIRRGMAKLIGRPSRPVDGEHMAGRAHATGALDGGAARPAADLQHPQPRLQGQRVDVGP